MREACQNYRRPKGIMGGPCLNCGRSQPEHARVFGNPVCQKCGHRHPGGEDNCPKDNATFQFREYEKAQQMLDATPLQVYRDIFNEITAKAIPFLTAPDDPGRILSYIVPCGPIHRAAGKLSHQMFDGETHLAAAIARIAELEAELSSLKTSS